RWLERIVARVAVDAQEVFPTDDLLDHIPLLLDGIADYMEDPADEITADVPVIAKAMELGELRLAQGFDAHEILKEYEILGGVLFSYLVGIVDSVEEECTRGELLACGQRLFRAVAIIQQVTANRYLRVADEHVREREDRLRGFNRTVSHELKNRLGAALGASAMLSESWVVEDAEQRARFLRTIADNLETMKQVLEDLLALSRMDRNARQQRNVMLPEAMAEAVRQLREMAEDQDVRISLAEDLPRVEVDAAAVELCLVNYISNGIKYADPDKPDRWVHLAASREGLEDEEEVVIEVRDNGIGVPPDARDRLFDRFYRVTGGTVTGAEGSGLGLSIVRETVESIGGRAWAEFDDDVGSTFKIALPSRRAADALSP
ncbi:MAG TPA: sensor histidine kinase, partial [Longimicrobiales bacterium]|nr:sensor histidine kinase [Longimicrobiales bacterium]